MSSKKIQFPVTFRRNQARGTTIRCDLAIWTSDKSDATQAEHVCFKDFKEDLEQTTFELPSGTYVATARVVVVHGVNGMCGHEVLVNGESMGAPKDVDIGSKDGATFKYQHAFSVK